MTTVSRHTPGTPCWLDLMTTDAAAARSFYGELFGWTFEGGSAETGGYTMCSARGQKAAGLGQLPAGSSYTPAWTVYFCTEDAQVTAEAVTREGGEVLKQPTAVLDRGRFAAFLDPTGALVGLWEPDRHIGASVVEEPGALSWCEVNTRDAARASRFYASVFELELERLEAPGFEYFTLSRAGKPRAGVLQMTEIWGDLPPHWMAYFGASDPDAIVSVAERLGGSVRVKPFDSPYGRIAVLVDPQGAVFSIVRPSVA
jgi:predicted enzyme related to lactoylglutathione lyase